MHVIYFSPCPIIRRLDNNDQGACTTEFQPRGILSRVTSIGWHFGGVFSAKTKQTKKQ